MDKAWVKARSTGVKTMPRRKDILHSDILPAVYKISNFVPMSLQTMSSCFRFTDEGTEGTGPIPHSLCLAGWPVAHAWCRTLGCRVGDIVTQSPKPGGGGIGMTQVSTWVMELMLGH